MSNANVVLVDTLHDRIAEMKAISNLIHICSANGVADNNDVSISVASILIDRLAGEATKLASQMYDNIRCYEENTRIVPIKTTP